VSSGLLLRLCMNWKYSCGVVSPRASITKCGQDTADDFDATLPGSDVKLAIPNDASDAFSFAASCAESDEEGEHE
jgi:hypothetical protein